jgi:hypothetical protein
MTYAGARGATEAQMAQTLHYALPQDRLHPAFNRLDLDRPVSDLAKRLEALSLFRSSDDFQALSLAFKRVGNILSGQTPGEVDPAFFFEDEKKLFEELERLPWRKSSSPRVATRSAPGALDAAGRWIVSSMVLVMAEITSCATTASHPEAAPECSRGSPILKSSPAGG